MTPREKLLALITAGLVGVLSLVYGGAQLYRAFDRRHRELQNVQKQLQEAQFQIQRGIRVADRLNELAQRALPFERDRAQSLYRSWLIDVASELRIQDTKINPTTIRAVQGIYEEHAFTMEGKANLEQFCRLLYEIQFAPILHAVKSLTVQAIRDSRDLSFSLALNVLAMPGAPERNKLPRAKEAPDAPPLEEYLRPILSRNLFGPANNPPSLRVDPQYVLTRGQPFELAPRAEDPDKFDNVRVTVEANGLPGARVNSSGSRLSWTPQQPGEYQVQIRAVDDGLPPRETTATVRLVVRDPPPPPAPPARGPGFNPAKFAVVTAITHVGDQPQVWVSVRTEGRTLKLSPGDRFRIGDFEGEVLSINGREVVIRCGDKSTTLRLGDSLVQ